MPPLSMPEALMGVNIGIGPCRRGELLESMETNRREVVHVAT